MSSTPTRSAELSTEDDLVVGRIGRPHGLRGELAVTPYTDVPERRFALGAVLRCAAPGVPRLTVADVREHSGRLLVRFAEVADRTAAEAVRGAMLTIGIDELGPAGDDADDEAWWDSELIGLQVVTTDGRAVGRVSDVLHPPGGELLSITAPDDPDQPDGREVLVPFVAALVPEVDVAGGRIVIDPPAGLLEL